MLESNFIHAKGLQLAYQYTGEGQVVLCVHGNFASKRWFQEQLKTPPPGCTIIALDLPNFGESETMPEAISIQAYADYLYAFCQALHLEHFHLLGHSLGGAVAMAFAAKHPQHLSSLILLDSAPPEGLKTPEERYLGLEMLKGQRELMAQALAPTMPTTRPSYFNDIVSDALSMNPAAFSGNARALEQFDYRKSFANFDRPVLVVHGAKDIIITRAMAEATAAAFPQAQLELWTQVGHSPQLEMAGQFNALLATFVKEV